MKINQHQRRFTKLVLRLVLASSLATASISASALNILLSNDDGLTSNIKALFIALKTAGHDVIVSAPCQGQSGMGAAVKFLKPIKPLTAACLNNGGSPGDPGVGPVTKKQKDFDYQDFFYVNGTPIMATAYGLDILAPARWGAAPDLVVSGPNQGQNVGSIVISSGTVGNVQYAASRGVPAIALSAGLSTEGEKDKSGNHIDNPLSLIVADHAVTLLNELMKKADKGPILPAGLALNVNFPEIITPSSKWSFSRIGSYNFYKPVFTENLSKDPLARGSGLKTAVFPGISLNFNSEKPGPDQLEDEAVVYKNKIAVSAMQVAFEPGPEEQQWLRLQLTDLFAE
ncbi:MAG: 5'/3'-nucleotidase SurE [Pseudomonadota bacterium]|nr:5'/3'-nucleotidase SurE [Pseudomonadota bacterium]